MLVLPDRVSVPFVFGVDVTVDRVDVHVVVAILAGVVVVVVVLVLVVRVVVGGGGGGGVVIAYQDVGVVSMFGGV